MISISRHIAVLLGHWSAYRDRDACCVSLYFKNHRYVLVW